MSVQTRKLIGRSLLLLGPHHDRRHARRVRAGRPCAGCAHRGARPEATAAPAPAKEKVQLRFVVMDYDEKIRPDTQALVDEFNAAERDRGRAGCVGWGEGHDTLLTQISGGQAPDLANGNAQWVGEWSGINEVAAAQGPAVEGVPGELRAGRPGGVHHRRQADGDALLPRPARSTIARICSRRRA